MLAFVTVVLAAVAARFLYPIALERRAAARRPLSPSGIIRGAEPITLVHKNAPGVLLLHGAGDTPQVLEALAQHLHINGFTVRVPLLSSHGRSLASLRRASANTWIDEAQREFEDVRQGSAAMYVVGLSMGADLCVQLAARALPMRAMVLLAPYLEMPGFVTRAATSSVYWGWAMPYFSSMGSGSIRDRAAAARALGHGILTPAMLRAMHDVVERTSEALPKVTAPTLIIHSRGDNRVGVNAIEHGFQRLGASEKKLEFTEGAAHVISVDFGYQRVFQMTTDWLKAH